MADRIHTPTPGFVVLYRWKLKPGAEESFVESWIRITEILRSRGSLGSRLHHGSDGFWYSYAQWPSAQARDAAGGLPDDDAIARMKSAIAESLPEVILNVRVDRIP